MVIYKPPDHVIVSVGASFRTEPLVSAANRLHPLVVDDASHFAGFGFEDDFPDAFREHIDEVVRLHRDKRAKNKDTPPQMAAVAETMSSIRAWLATLRAIAALNLSLDTPSLLRLWSPAPELHEGYGRDMLEDLRRRIAAARDLKPRLEEVGLTEAFLGRGAKLATQLQTAIGQKDIDGSNLALAIRRLYLRKGMLYMRLARTCRAAAIIFSDSQKRARLYHLDEIEPRNLELVRVKKGTA